MEFQNFSFLWVAFVEFAQGDFKFHVVCQGGLNESIKVFWLKTQEEGVGQPACKLRLTLCRDAAQCGQAMNFELKFGCI